MQAESRQIPQKLSAKLKFVCNHLLGVSFQTATSNYFLLGCERFMATQAEFHFSWVCFACFAFTRSLNDYNVWSLVARATQHLHATALIIHQTNFTNSN